MYYVHNYVGIKDAILPQKNYGKPKDTEKAVIKLLAKKRKSKLAIPFLKKLPIEKEKGIYILS